jgi:hypothetical protein
MIYYLLVLTVWLDGEPISDTYWGYTKEECFVEGQRWLDNRPKDGNVAKFACLEDKDEVHGE